MKNEAVDALSRHPHNLPEDKNNLAEVEVDVFAGISYIAPSISQIRNAALTLQEQDNLRIQEVREYAAKDDVYQSLKHVIFNGFTNQRGQITHPLKNSEESRTI